METTAKNDDPEQYTREKYDLVYHLVKDSESLLPDVSKSMCDVRICIVKQGSRVGNLTNEMDTLKRLSPLHPNITRYFAITKFYIFMENVPLGSLDKYLNPGIVPPLLSWTSQICSALVYLHSRGVAHNQLFPQHILVSMGGSHLKLCDFSGALWNDPDASSFDVFALGHLLRFCQHYECPMASDMRAQSSEPDESLLELLKDEGLKLVDVIRACWATPTERPPIVKLQLLLSNLREFSYSLSGTTIEDNFYEQYRNKSQEFLHRKIFLEESPGIKHENIQQAVVKFPRYDKHNEGTSSDWTSFSRVMFRDELDFILDFEIKHPNILSFLAITQDFMFSPYYPLGSMQNYIKPGVHPPVLEWALQLCGALAYLHSKEVAHFQVAPYNILVANGGADLILCDFGTMKYVDSAELEGGPSAPELADNNAPCDGNRADVYSLGLIVWFIQNEGRTIPENLIYVPDPPGSKYLLLRGAHSHLDLLDLSGDHLVHVDIIRSCLSPYDARPTSQELLERLQGVKQSGKN